VTATTVNYNVSRTAIGAEQYRAVIEITSTTNGLELELFVFDTATDAFVCVATPYQLEVIPNNKPDAITGGDLYYRGSTVLRDFTGTYGAQQFIEGTVQRISYLCVAIDRAAFPYTGTTTGEAPGAYGDLYPTDVSSSGTTEELSSIVLKAGDTFALPMRWSVAGVYIDLSGYTITSSVRRRTDETNGSPIDTLTCTADPDQTANKGKFEVTATDVQTALWPITTLLCDVRLDNGVEVTHTESFEIVVRRAVT